MQKSIQTYQTMQQYTQNATHKQQTFKENKTDVTHIKHTDKQTHIKHTDKQIKKIQRINKNVKQQNKQHKTLVSQ